MPFRICKTFEVENGHMLSKHPDACQFPHGHTRKVEFVLESDTLDDNEMVCDFKILKGVIYDYLMTLDHALCMNTEDPAFSEMKARYGDRVVAFEKTDPTTEVMAREIFLRCQKALSDYSESKDQRYPLRPSVKLASVRLWETSSSWAEYWD
jgi:6-pyruvoyltetrahydropterin/6-carboxytetrahydropterin synthase